MVGSNAPRPGNLPPGYDEEDPYEGEDLSDYPGWWRRNIEEFRRYDLRPYRPPRFLDGAFTPPVLADLEEEFGVTVQLRTADPERPSDWQIVIDEMAVAGIGRERTSGGYTEYKLTSREFKELVSSVVDGGEPADSR